MSLTATYDGTLSRVRLAGTTYLNSNSFIEVDTAGWTASGGTIARSTAQAHEGVASLLLTPDGVSASASARSETVPAVAGRTHRGQAWVRCSVTRTVIITIVWRDAGGGFLSSSSASVSVTAGTWTLLQVDATAPVSTENMNLDVTEGGTPPSSDLLHIDEAMIGADPTALQRSTDQIRWSTVRGGADLPLGSVTLDDYEFAPDVINYYRLAGQTTSITPTITQVWVKSVARPFLNRPVTVSGSAPPATSRPGRGAAFDVVGRSLPVAVTDVRGSKRWTLSLRAQDQDEADLLDLIAASGDILYIQAPTTGRLSRVPTGYVMVGDTSETVLPTAALDVTVASWQCTRVAAPGPDVVGATSTWQTVINTYATWADVQAAHATWADLLTLIGDPTEVVVS